MATANKTAGKKSYAAPALSKGLDILEMMASEPEPKTLKEVSDKLGRSKGEIFRMMHVLEERGYMELDTDSDQYSMSLKMFEIAHLHSAVKQLSAVAGPALEGLAHTIGQSCHMAIPSDGKGLVIAQQDADSDFRFGIKLGHEVPLADTCSGHLFLAYASTEERKKMLARQPDHLKHPLSDETLKEIINRVKEKGYETRKSSQVQGVTDIGFPVFNHRKRIAASLVVPFLEHLDGSHRMGMEETIDHLRTTSETVSRQLGYLE